MIKLKQEFYCRAWETWEKTFTRQEAIHCIKSCDGAEDIVRRDMHKDVDAMTEEELVEAFEVLDSYGYSLDDLGILGYGAKFAGDMEGIHTEDHEPMEEGFEATIL